jgi:two-component system cell cycle sensor histidine kinase/response regulator CckA
MEQAVIKGMLQSLGDPYSDFLTPDMIADMEKQIGGTIVGIGTHLEMHEQQIRVVTPLPDSPAFAAGIQPGDLIVQIDGQTTEKLALGDVLSELSILLSRLLGENVELKLDQASDLWPVKADLHQFEQVIINLAVNARDAMPEGGKLVIRTANVSESQVRELGNKHLPASDYVLIEVSDTGSGMTPEVMLKIFEPFFSTKEIGRGTGLGLSTVYGIVKQTGGYVFPESEPGRGTTMRVYLPRYVEAIAEAEAEPEKIERRPEKPKDLTGQGTVLLVEDEDAVRSFAARALGQRGYNVLQATTGVEALEVFARHQGEVDLVVSDVVMPEMDGPTLFEKLRRQRPDLKVIFISGYAEDAFRQHLAENEDFMFLQKPFDLKELAAAVKAALQS